jgi:hypothetical protein
MTFLENDEGEADPLANDSALFVSVRGVRYNDIPYGHCNTKELAWEQTITGIDRDSTHLSAESELFVRHLESRYPLQPCFHPTLF